jgi:hypothetical protein
MDAAAAQALLKGACLQQASPADKILQATERAGYLDIAGLNLQFDRGHLAVFNPLRLLCDSGVALSLQALIGCRVTSVSLSEDDLELLFDDRLLLRISLRDEDYTGPEAAVFYAPPDTGCVNAAPLMVF